VSETPQGAGWWRALDGRWYPPHTHPSYQQQPGQPAPPAQPVPPGQPGPAAQSAPPAHPAPPGPSAQPAKSGGIPKGLLIAGGIVLVVVVLGYTVSSYFLHKVGDRLGGSIAGGDCTLIDTNDVDAVLGGKFDLLELGGFTKIATPVLDSRVLADATTCWATQNDADPGRLVRIARLKTADAGNRFQQERTSAHGVKEDRGGGVTVESQAYFNKDVSLGDEAFCTTTDFTGSSGVLVRHGDTLIYVSLTSPDFNPQIDPTAARGGTIKFADDDVHCDLAQKLAEKVQ